MVPFAVLMIADRRTETLGRCAEVLGTLPGAAVEWLPDDPRYVVAALRAPSASCLVLCGGDSLSLPAGIRDGLSAEITRTFPGFAEAIRRDLADDPVLSTLADVRGLASRQLAILALPASPALCQRAVARILPLQPTLLALLLGQDVHLATPSPSSPSSSYSSNGIGSGGGSLGEEQPALLSPLTEPEEVPMGSGIQVLSLGGPEGPATARGEEGEERLRWEAALLSLEARLERDQWYQMPDSILDIAPAQEVLEQAGGRATALLMDGRLAGVFGFPDLLRPSSKALLVIETRGVLEVLVLHRHPGRVGIVGRGNLLRVGDAEAESLSRTQTPTPYGGNLFAVEHNAVYLEREGRVYAWDGRREHDMGSEAQATASLLLRWSER